MRLVVKGNLDLLPHEAQVLLGGKMAEVVGYDSKTQKYEVELQGAVEEVEGSKLERILKETTFTRRCEGGKYTPNNVVIRCMSTTPNVNDLIAPSPPSPPDSSMSPKTSVHLGVQTEPEAEGPKVHQAAQTEPEAQGPKTPVVAETDQESADMAETEQPPKAPKRPVAHLAHEPTSFLEEAEVVAATQEATKAESRR